MEGEIKSLDKFQGNHYIKIKRSTNFLVFFLLILYFLSLPVWYFFVVMSIPGFRSESALLYWVGMGPAWVYPALILIAFLSARSLIGSDKFIKSILVMLLPPIVSFGWTFLMVLITGYS